MMSLLKTHLAELNAWHLELAILQDAISRILRDLSDYDEGLAATGHVLNLRLESLVESCPFPPVELRLPDLDPLFEPDYADPDLEAQVLAAELSWRSPNHD